MACKFRGCEDEFVAATGFCREHNGLVCHCCGKPAVGYCAEDGCDNLVCDTCQYCGDHMDEGQKRTTAIAAIKKVVRLNLILDPSTEFRLTPMAKDEALSMTRDVIALMTGILEIIDDKQLQTLVDDAVKELTARMSKGRKKPESQDDGNTENQQGDSGSSSDDTEEDDTEEDDTEEDEAEDQSPSGPPPPPGPPVVKKKK